MRAGFMKSTMAEPSRRNSGHETTLNDTGRVWLEVTMSETQSPVPTGTVDLLTMMIDCFMCLAICSAAERTYLRSASPSTPSGVPTAMNAKSASSRASVVVGGEAQAPGRNVALDHFLEPWLVDRQDAFVQVGDALFIDIQRHDLIAEVRKARAGDETDITDADDADFPHFPSPWLPCGRV